MCQMLKDYNIIVIVIDIIIIDTVVNYSGCISNNLGQNYCTFFIDDKNIN